MLPRGTGDLAPPGRSGDSILDKLVEAVRWKVHPEDEGPLEALGIGTVACGFHERSKVAISNRVSIYMERREGDGANGAFVIRGEGIAVVGDHSEGSTGQSDRGAVLACIG